MLSIAPSTVKGSELGFQARSLFKALRPKQWPMKQAFTFVCLPMIFFHGWQVIPELIALFMIFCAISGAAYLINDIKDRDADILHPKKRHRPIAAGHVSIPLAISTATILILTALVVSFSMGSMQLGGIVLAYIVISQVYNAGLKHFPRIDVILVGSLYSIRAAAGFIMVDIYPHGWYLWVILAGLLGCNMVFVKRHSELRVLGSDSQTRRNLKFYGAPGRLDREFTICAILTTFFFIPAAYSMHPLFTIATGIVIFTLYRLWNLVKIITEDMHPMDIILKDRTLLAAFGVFGFFFSVTCIFSALQVLP